MRLKKYRFRAGVCLGLLALGLSGAASLHKAAAQGQQAPPVTEKEAPGAPFPADRLAALLPPSVYFQGRSAPLQIRNAAGTAFADGPIVWAAPVDVSGYSTSVQNRYQFYFVTEGPLLFGKTALAAGAYGGGFLGDHFLLMDLGGHTLAEGPLENDTALRRPRPLMMLPVSPTSVRLYLGRHWVLLQNGTPERSTTGGNAASGR